MPANWSTRPDLAVQAHSGNRVDESVFHSYRCLLDRVRAAPPALQQLIAANTMEILGAALASAHKPTDAKQLSARVEQAKLILERHTEELVDMEQLAASLGVSYERFRHLFKQQTGLAPYQYHLQLRINRAKELLRETALPLTEITASLGFADLSHFSNIFKRKVGLWPSQWREAGRR